MNLFPHKRFRCMEVWGGNSRAAKSISVPGLDVWVGAEPHHNDQHGGDIYYMASCGAGDIIRFCLADVAGHGERTSRLAKRLRKLIGKYADIPDQACFAGFLNSEFSEQTGTGIFATALVIAYHTGTHLLTTCNAGHPPPLLYRSSSRLWQYLDQEPDDCVDCAVNLPFGVIETTRYQQLGLRLAPGDILILYTDGALDAHGRSDRCSAQTGLLDLTESLPTRGARLCGETLLARLKRAHELGDDITLMVLSRNGPGPL